MTRPTLYFYCYPQGPAEKAGYQHALVVLAEGLRELGLTFYSNIDYWPLKNVPGAFLFNQSPDVTPNDCDVVVLNNVWFDYGHAMPESLFRRKRPYRIVYFDHSDGVYTRSLTAEFKNVDVIFKAHFNKKVIGYGANIQPWSFGLSSRIIEATKEGGEWSNRRPVLLSNFRVGQQVRLKAVRDLYPLLAGVFEIDDSHDNFARPTDTREDLEWKITGRRHNPAYYAKLKCSQAVACFGGRYHSRILKPKRLSAALTRAFPKFFTTIYQWDSFRLWEAFSSGCLVFHIDLDKYGLRLPVMPKNREDYIGVDLDDIDSTVVFLKDQHAVLGAIAENGRSWATKHYSPLKTAERFLSYI